MPETIKHYVLTLYGNRMGNSNTLILEHLENNHIEREEAIRNAHQYAMYQSINNKDCSLQEYYTLMRMFEMYEKSIGMAPQYVLTQQATEIFNKMQQQYSHA